MVTDDRRKLQQNSTNEKFSYATKHRMKEPQYFKRLKIVILISAICAWIVIISYFFTVFKSGKYIKVRFKENEKFNSRLQVQNTKTTNAKRSSYVTNKLILAYTPFFGDTTWSNILKGNCDFDVTNINVSYNRDDFPKSDVVIFHSRDMPEKNTLSSLRRSRPKESGQLWVYFTMESFRNNPSINDINEYFDLVSTYRLNSDVTMKYGEYSKLLKAPPYKFIKYYERKQNAVAWIVSNCRGSQRNSLVEKMISNGVEVHVAGACSSKYKHRFSCSGDCSGGIKRYKFFLSAENTLCEDYVTEKYWKALQNNVIPIVFGGSNYSNPAIAIPGSFIDALTFSSPKNLADYIKLVISNHTLYNSYFDWKYKWQMSGLSYYCRLCKHILYRKPIKPNYNRLKESISEEQCTRPERKFSSWINL